MSEQQEEGMQTDARNDDINDQRVERSKQTENRSFAATKRSNFSANIEHTDAIDLIVPSPQRALPSCGRAFQPRA